jgi:RHS repeat-associated protein
LPPDDNRVLVQIGGSAWRLETSETANALNLHSSASPEASRSLTSGEQVSAMTAPPNSDADFRTSELIALAEGLGKDRDRIFFWVRDNIRYIHYHGCKKGAHLTFLERSGNHIDTSALLIALWRAADIECRYVYGMIDMPMHHASGVDWYHYLGVEDFILDNFVFNRGTPVSDFVVRPGRPGSTRAMYRMWAQARVDGEWQNFDPSFKLIQPVLPNINLASAMGYNRSDLLASLGAGTSGPNSITSLNYGALSSHLASRVTALVSTLRTNYAGNTVSQTIAAWIPFTHTPVLSSAFPIANAGAEYEWAVVSNEIYEVIPPELYSTLRINVQSVGLDTGTIRIASLRGRRLGLVFQNGYATLQLDDTNLTVANVPLGYGTPLQMSAHFVHAESDRMASGVNFNQSHTMPAKTGGAYALVYGFDVTSEYVEARQDVLDRYRRQGLSDADEPLRLETLNVIGLNWLLQTELSSQLAANLASQSHTFIHRFGRVAHEPATAAELSLYIDVPMNYSGAYERGWDFGVPRPGDQLLAVSFLHSAMEHGVLEQMQPSTGNTAVSTAKILKLANDAGTPVYLADSASTWSSVQGQLAPNVYTGPSSDPASELGQMQYAVNQNGLVLVPKTSATSGELNARGFVISGADENLFVGMLINGSYSGGYSGNFVPVVNSAPPAQQASVSALRFDQPITFDRSYGGDPVDMATGDFTHTRELLSAGDGLVRGLSLTVSYHGASRFKDEAKLGYGWTHSYHARAVERTDIEGAFGMKSPVEMATSIVGAVILSDLIHKRDQDADGNVTTNQSLKAKNSLAAALVATWVTDQIKNNGVSIVIGDRIVEFYRQGDGSYTSPPGSTATLSKAGSYQLTERHGPTWTFDASNRLASVVDLWGKTLSLAYGTNNQVASVTDAYGRRLNFNYASSGYLSSVNETQSAGRSLTFSVNFSGDLTSFTDAEGKADRFTYLSEHRISRYSNHDSSIIAENFYDSMGRVVAQRSMGDAAKTWKFFYAPGVTVERQPDGSQVAETLHMFDERKRPVEVLKKVGPITHRALTSFDGQNRVVRKEKLVSDGAGGWPVSEIEISSYDASHNLRWSRDAMGYYTDYVYDPSHRVTSIIDKRGGVTRFENYNAQHQPLQITDREGRVITYTYVASADPAAGSIATSTEGGFATTYSYDTRGVLASIAFAGGLGAESRTNNVVGDPITITDTLGRQTSITYNKRREVLTQTSPGTDSSGTRTIVTTYDNARNVASVTNPRGFITRYAYSPTRKPLATTLPGGATISTTYDARDQVASTRDPLNQQTSFTYDALGRVISVTDPLARTTNTSLQDWLRTVVTQSPAPLNIQTKAIVDQRGQLIRSEDGLGNYAQPQYDGNGNQSAWRDRRGKFWYFNHDQEDRLVSTTSPAGRTISQTWNARGLLASVTQPSGASTTFNYDARRRLASRADAVGTVAYTLNDASEVTAITQGSLVLSRTYHPSGQVATYTNADGETITYDYDKSGNLVSLTYPAMGSVAALTVTYTYDNRDRLATVSENGRTTSYAWDDAGRLRSMTRPNGTRRALRWDAAGQLLGIEERPASGAPIMIRSYSYDAAGRTSKRLAWPQGAAWTEPGWNAVYDDDNRLTNLGGVPLSYSTDGNLLGSRLPDGPWGAAGASNNANGVFTWNVRNQLTRVVRSDNGHQIDYAYDPEGHLVRWRETGTGTTRLLIDPHGGPRSHVLARLGGDGQTTRYIYGIGLLYEVRQDGSARYYHYDQLGSTVALTNPEGAVVGQADYSPYGSLLSANGELATPGRTPFLWVGAHGVMTDAATGLHQMRARWYSSHLRRFLSEDPIGFAGGENFYLYANGNPASLIDPLGLCSIDCRTGLAYHGPNGWSYGNKRFAEQMAAVTVGPLMVVAGFVPWVGDLMEFGTVVAPSSSRLDRGLSAGSLTLNVMTAGMAPNYGPIKQGISSMVDAFSSAPGGTPTTPLYRAVGPDELADINSTQALRNLGSAEGKYFTSSAEHASDYARQAVRAFGDPPYTIIRTDVPTSSLPRPVSVDGGIPAYVIPDASLPGLRPTVMDTMPIPRPR